MSTLLRCRNGHEWRPGSARSERAGPGDPPRCPFCGAEDTLITPPSLPEERPVISFGDVSREPPTLANYEALEKIGEGGMGVVYKARKRDSGEIVALKVIRRERLNSDELRDRFIREVRLSQKLDHANIVRVFDADSAGATPFLVMEYVPGITLQKLVEQIGPLPVAQACDFVLQAARGLDYAAGQLVHRDIKPANLMVVAPGGLPLPPRATIKVLDMGVARALDDETMQTLTRDGSVIGTPDYISPEQADDPRRADTRSDLYSLGCTLYYLLTGNVPFPGGSLLQKLDRHRQNAPTPVDQLRPETRGAVASVVQRLLAKPPDKRIQSPRELAEMLESLLRTGGLHGTHQAGPLELETTLGGHTGAVAGLAFCPTGRTLVSGGADKTVRLWDLSTGKQKLCIGPGRQAIGCVAVAPGGNMVLAGHGVTVRAWTVDAGREVYNLAGHIDTVRSLAISTDGKLVVTGGDDRSVRIWDPTSRREIQRFTKHTGSVTGLSLSPDGKLALSASRDQSLRLWETATGREVRNFAVPKGQVLCVAFSLDGKTAWSGHYDTTLRQWEIQSGKELRRLTGHKGMVQALACQTPTSGVGTGVLLSGSTDQTARTWEMANGMETAISAEHGGAVQAVALSADGKRGASAGADALVRLWRVPG